MKSMNKERGVRKDGTTPIQVTVRVPGYAGSRSATYDTVEECEAFRVKAEREMRLHAPALPARAKALTQQDLDRETIKGTVEAYLRSKYASGRAKGHAASLLRHLGNARRSSVTVQWVEDFIEHMRGLKTYRGAPYAWATIKILLTLMAKALRWRATHHRLVNIPVPFNAKTMFPKGWDKKRVRRLEVGEEELLMARLANHRCHRSRPFWIALVQFALETGARQQELLNASWSDVNWDERDWFIPKGKTGERHVPLSLRAIELLRQLHDLRHPDSDRVFHELGNPASVCALFRRFSREAGLVDYRFHDLRHDAISRLVANKRKMTMHLIALMVGHSSSEMTERYSHLRGRETAILLD